LSEMTSSFWIYSETTSLYPLLQSYCPRSKSYPSPIYCIGQFVTLWDLLHTCSFYAWVKRPWNFQQICPPKYGVILLLIFAFNCLYFVNLGSLIVDNFFVVRTAGWACLHLGSASAAQRIWFLSLCFSLALASSFIYFSCTMSIILS